MHIALALLLGVGLGAGSAQAQAILEVGGAAGSIGVTTLTTAKVPAAGVNWTAAGGAGVKYSSLISPAVAVGVDGPVTLKFTHRYNFETGWDGGAVFVRVNGGAATYVPTGSFSLNGYVSDLSGPNHVPPDSSISSVFTGGLLVFTNQSTDYSVPTLIESVANLGEFTAGQTISVEFRGGWDESTTSAAPNWEIGTVEITNSAPSAILNVNFTADGTAGFTATSDAGLAGPWTYLKPISRFEIDGDAAFSLEADRYAPVSTGSVIDLNGAKLSVVLLSGTLDANDTFTLFDLSGGTTLAGTIDSISLPLGTWDTSQLAANGNGTIKYVGPPTETVYIGPNTTGNANTWNTPANWDTGSGPTGTLDAAIPDGKYAVANNASTPAYSGDLMIGAGATLQIGYTTDYAQAYNALGTPGTTTITMKAGALISTRNGGSPVIPAITLLGDAKIRLGESTETPANADFNYPVTGAFTFTIESNQQTPTIDLNASNGFSALVINTLTGRGTPPGTFNANVAGCLGNGAITINPNGTLTHQLAFKAALASTAANTLNLNGEGPLGTGVGRVRMDANNTVGFLNIYGFPYPAGTYGRVGTPATVDRQVNWIEGDFVLTVTGPVADSAPPTVAITDNFPSGSILLGQQISYTLTFNEAVQPLTVGTDDFENAGSASIAVNSVTANVNGAVYTVKVTPSNTGSVQLKIKSDAVITDLSGNNLVVPFTDDSTITVNAPTLKGQYGIWKQYAGGGINPNTGVAWKAGDQYRLAFHTAGTSGTITGVSNDPAVYNAYVTAEAHTNPALVGSSWTALITVNLDGATTQALSPKSDPRVISGTNDQTGGSAPGGAGVPVLAMDGSTCIARNNADIWDGWSNPFENSLGVPNAAGTGNNTQRLSGLFYSPFLNQHGAQVVTPDAIHGKDIATGNDKSGNHVNALGNTTDDTTNSRGNSNANNVDRVWNRFTDATSGNKAFYALSEVLTVQAIGGGNTFADWIDDYPGVGGLTGLGDDADGDGIDNGVENFFGTDPSASSGGLVAGAVTGNTFTFTHPQNATPASDLTAAYQWSKDLATFNAGGTTDGAGTTVTFTTQPDTPAAGTTTVTATVTGTATSKLFVRVDVTQG